MRLELTDATGRFPVALPVEDRKAGDLGVYAAPASPDGKHVVAGAERGLVVASSRTGPSTPRLGLAENGCGPESLVRFDHHGHGIRVSVPSPTKQAGLPSYVGHHADTVTMVWNAGGGCQGGTDTLFRYDAAHHRSTAELGTTVNGGTVTGAVPAPADR